MRVGWVVVVCSPLVEVVGNIVAAGVWRCVLEVDNNVAMMRGSPWRWIIQLEKIAVLRIIVYVISLSFIPRHSTHGQRQLGRPRQ